MNLIIITIVLLVLAELGRVSFLLKKTGLRPKIRYAIGSSLLVISAVLPTIVGIATNDIWLFPNILFILFGICCESLFYVSDEAEKALEGKRFKQLASYLPVIIITILFSLYEQHEINQNFENKFMQTQEITITEEPSKAMVSGNTIVVLENNTGKDIVIRINDDNLDILKLQKGDKVKHLKDRQKEETKIVTLRGEAYKK